MSTLAPIASFQEFAPTSGEATAVLERPQADDQWVTEILLVNPWDGDIEDDEEGFSADNLVSFSESY